MLTFTNDTSLMDWIAVISAEVKEVEALQHVAREATGPKERATVRPRCDSREAN